MNKLDAQLEYRNIHPHEIEAVFAAECDPATDKLARVQQLFSVGSVASYHAG